MFSLELFLPFLELVDGRVEILQICPILAHQVFGGWTVGRHSACKYTPAQVPIRGGVQSVLGCEKLTQARKRVSDLEFARKAFERNAAKGAPILGASVVSESVATQD